ncbi:dihydrofolate reductase family protein [Oscillatoria sp. CS-180]|uniref:dihydrofolate reductase family protein n=1 Tax=Oscillatoria sp. CS-180 TaxID=3021720 RepID=UPI0023311783|nr:dihydrofolate reductase family protein [Oscillatoria sp. CS-180]MDB9529378.1 dihydrofolate reductase family protein [Oscillatoria sp. CS-180]
MKVVYYLATSLDGFIADVNESVAWLEKLTINHQATGYDSFFDTVDALLMGRKTYVFVYHHGQWPYGDKPTWVCTSQEVSRMDGCNLQHERNPAAAIQQAKRQGVATLWVVGGGRLVETLIKENLLTHISVSVMPVLLGDGIGLVHSLSKPLYLRQESSVSMSGFTQIEYQIDNSLI